MDVMRHYSPNGELVAFVNTDRLEIRIMRYKPGALIFPVQPIFFKCKLTIHKSHDIVAVTWLKRTVDNNDVTVKDSSITHRVTRYAGIESSVGMANHFLNDVYPVTGIIARRRRKTGMKMVEYWQFYRITATKSNIEKFGLHCQTGQVIRIYIYSFISFEQIFVFDIFTNFTPAAGLTTDWG